MGEEGGRGRNTYMLAKQFCDSNTISRIDLSLADLGRQRQVFHDKGTHGLQSYRLNGAVLPFHMRDCDALWYALTWG